MSLHLFSHILTHSCSITLPPHPAIVTHGPGRIHLAGLPCRPTSKLQVQMDSLQALRLCGVSSTLRSLLLSQDSHRFWPRMLRQAEQQAPRVREVVEAGAVVCPKSWILNQVWGRNMTNKYKHSYHRVNLQTFNFFLYILYIVRLSSGHAESSESGRDSSQMIREKRKERRRRSSQCTSSEKAGHSSQE